MISIKVYGRDWCDDTQRTRQRLDELNVPYEYINTEKDPAAEQWVKQQNNGKQKTPTVDLAGHILVEPPNDQLDQALRDNGLIP